MQRQVVALDVGADERNTPAQQQLPLPERPQQKEGQEQKRQRRQLEQQVLRQLRPVLQRPRYELRKWERGQGFPPGFRFRPTDLELLDSLKEQVKLKEVTQGIFQFLNLYAFQAPPS